MTSTRARSIHVREIHQVHEERYPGSGASCFSIECTGPTGTRLFIEIKPAETRKLLALLSDAVEPAKR